MPPQLSQHGSPKKCDCVRARPKPGVLLISNAAIMCFQKEEWGAARPDGHQARQQCQVESRSLSSTSSCSPGPWMPWHLRDCSHITGRLCRARPGGAIRLVLGSRPRPRRPLGMRPRRMTGWPRHSSLSFLKEHFPSLERVPPLDPGSPSQRVFCGSFPALPPSP